MSKKRPRRNDNHVVGAAHQRGLTRMISQRRAAHKTYTHTHCANSVYKYIQPRIKAHTRDDESGSDQIIIYLDFLFLQRRL
jgi:hypothetical protein